MTPARFDEMKSDASTILAVPSVPFYSIAARYRFIAPISPPRSRAFIAAGAGTWMEIGYFQCAGIASSARMTTD